MPVWFILNRISKTVSGAWPLYLLILLRLHSTIPGIRSLTPYYLLATLYLLFGLTVHMINNQQNISGTDARD